ncbi:hypothetical protein V1514DRAFT_332607, partial [Lipomyces japonicus]|uniref:uncharacterized protein n=1 Tax=Lipomyces japonicus TaxID=56871 RepID=UPI0034CDA82E
KKKKKKIPVVVFVADILLLSSSFCYILCFFAPLHHFWLIFVCLNLFFIFSYT